MDTLARRFLGPGCVDPMRKVGAVGLASPAYNTASLSALLSRYPDPSGGGTRFSIDLVGRHVDGGILVTRKGVAHKVRALHALHGRHTSYLGHPPAYVELQALRRRSEGAV